MSSLAQVATIDLNKEEVRNVGILSEVITSADWH